MNRRMVRCLDGHPYDATAHASCPVCGAAPVQAAAAPTTPVTADPVRQEAQDRQDVPKPRPGWRGRVAAAAALACLGGGWLALAWVRSPPIDCRIAESARIPACAGPPAVKRDPERGPSRVPEGVRQGGDAPRGGPPTGGRVAAQPQEASGPASRAEAERAVAGFLAVDPARMNALRAALAPLDPADVDPALEALSPLPFAESQLHLSRTLRLALATDRGFHALSKKDFASARTLFTAVLKAPRPEVDRPPSRAAYGLALALIGAPSGPDRATAATWMRVAAEMGNSNAILDLANDADLARMAGLDVAAIGRLLENAAIQDPDRAEPVLRQHGLDPKPAARLVQTFAEAREKRDMPTLIAAYRAIGERRAPGIDERLSPALAGNPAFRGPYDRLLVAGMDAAADGYTFGRLTLSVACERGLAGLPQDLPNAAIWAILTLAPAKADDDSWDAQRTRLAGLKDRLSPALRALVEQIGREFGVP
ncbi:hypothetical protein VP06_32005 [Methylobacterium aquaticum]|uniref:Uncharacterized protein n=2 Tax=Methylobacterium aquaticum TaxID=270351 RepID=A0A0J6RW20_9HYPH|nr:hypothetical protein VP06_32005 [Methylobacterium aquaticum]